MTLELTAPKGNNPAANSLRGMQLALSMSTRGSHTVRVRSRTISRTRFLTMGSAALLLCAAELVSAEEISYRYVGWVGSEDFAIRRSASNPVVGEITASGDAVYPATFCSEESPFYCFVSSFHAFAAPKKRSPGQREWTALGITFELITDTIQVEILGRRVEGTWLVRTRAEDTGLGRRTGVASYSLFSPQHDLIGVMLDREIPLLLGGGGERVWSDRPPWRAVCVRQTSVGA